MATPQELEKLLAAPLEEVLLKLYSVSFLKWLYDLCLRRLADANPNQLPPLDPTQVSGKDRVPRKAYLVALLLAVLRNQELGRQLLAALPKPARDVLTAACWERRVNVATIETALGQPVAEVNPDDRRRYHEPWILLPEHGFLAIVSNLGNYWALYSYPGRDQPRKQDYSLALPEAVRVAFRAFMPPPQGYEIEPLDDLPAKAGQRYACGDAVFADVRLAAGYIVQGQVRLTKSGRIALPSVRALRLLLREPEFFREPETGELALVRTRLLVGGVAAAGREPQDAMLAGAGSAEAFRDLVEKALSASSFLHEELLNHLANRYNLGCRYNNRAVQNLAAFFARLPAGQWVAWENLRRYHTLRESVPTLFLSGRAGLRAQAAPVQNAWSSVTYVDARSEFELVGEPLLKGFAFLLATFGLAEIAYDPPKHPTYHSAKNNYLTPFDGLKFVRLTPLGEFVFRRRDTIEVAAEKVQRTSVTLDETRLLATCRNPDALTELALKQLMEKLAPGRYAMTPKSLVAGCQERADVEKRIGLFRRVIAPTPPAVWEHFFERTLARTTPLVPEPEFIVLKVGPDEEIRRLFASDPVLRELALKVEGLRVAVRRGELRQLVRRLEQFGYLSTVSRLLYGVM